VGPDDQVDIPCTDTQVRVLVVDDHPAARDVLRALIGGIDAFALVGEATSGEEALEAAATLAPCLIIMDQRMPGLDGLEAPRRLKARHPEMVIVLISADDLPQHAVAASGAASFIHKHQLSRRRLLDVWRAQVM
jgi:two-component system, NarL family, invasion response regulator UvrY